MVAPSTWYCERCGVTHRSVTCPQVEANRDPRPGTAWPEGISDGLSLACGICGAVPSFDYTVSDELWRDIVPEEYQRGVVCLPCLDVLGARNGVRVGLYLKRVQFTGTLHTVVLRPSMTHSYG